MKKPPCKGCGRRHEKCHAECEAYRDYRATVKKAADKKNKERIFGDFTCDKALKSEKAKQKYQK